MTPENTPVPDWAWVMVGGPVAGAATLGDCPRRVLAIWAAQRPPKRARSAPGDQELFLHQARATLAIMDELESPARHAWALGIREHHRLAALELGAPYLGAEHLGQELKPEPERRRGWWGGGGDSPGW